MNASEILGHKTSLNIINSFIEKSQFSGAYIFSGPEGIGKRMIARFIAEKLNCSAHDLHIIEGVDQQIKIDDIRNILRLAGLSPYQGDIKIFLIDNAHKLNIEAANSLLKILEEPPKNTLFILITHKPQNIIKTVYSRCKNIKFSPLPRKDLEDILIKNYSLAGTVAHFIAYYAEGRLGHALRLKNSPELVGKNKIFDSFVLSDKSSRYSQPVQTKEQIRAGLNILASWFRDIYLLKAGMGENEMINLDRIKLLKDLAAKYSFKELDDSLTVISETMFYLDKNINSKLLMHNLGAQLWKA